MMEIAVNTYFKERQKHSMMHESGPHFAFMQKVQSEKDMRL